MQSGARPTKSLGIGVGCLAHHASKVAPNELFTYASSTNYTMRNAIRKCNDPLVQTIVRIADGSKSPLKAMSFISDIHGGIYNPRGLDIPAVIAYVQQTGSVVDFPESEPVGNDELFALPCEVLIPAALENQIRADNAGKIQASLIVEGANGPTSPEADRILREKGVMIIPDILANAGGVTVSYFEWVQGLQSFFWSEKEIFARLERIMTAAFEDCWTMAERKKVDMRTAASILAIDRVAEATKLRGIYP